MNSKVKCAVCGTENDYFSFSEDVGTVEKHYFCENCGFLVEMVYSSELRGMAITNDKNMLQQQKKYENIIKELSLEYYDI
jgi:C4-type Zn-finger protein